MTIIKFEEAKANFEDLASKAQAGETMVVSRDDGPPFVIAPFKKRPIKLGILEGMIHTAPDFNETSEDIIRAWEGDYGNDPT